MRLSMRPGTRVVLRGKPCKSSTSKSRHGGPFSPLSHFGRHLATPFFGLLLHSLAPSLIIPCTLQCHLCFRSLECNNQLFKSPRHGPGVASFWLLPQFPRQWTLICCQTIAASISNYKMMHHPLDRPVELPKTLTLDPGRARDTSLACCAAGSGFGTRYSP